MKRWIVKILIVCLYYSCDNEKVILKINSSFPNPRIEKENTLSIKKIRLGKKLFNDSLLSSTGRIACASCHDESTSFTDAKKVSVGVHERTGTRNSPSLFNVVFLNSLNWDGGTNSIETQMLVPISDHREFDSSIPEILNKLNSNEKYRNEFINVWNDTITAYTLTRTIGAFLRTIISDNSKYDQEINGLYSYNYIEQKGYDLFFSDSLNCSSCHTPPLFTNVEFMNNGLEEISIDSGRARVTFQHRDLGLFKVPTLRNILLTGPYMHDGRFNSIEEVLNHYQFEVENHFNLSPEIRKFKLKREDQESIIAFLKCLTDTTYENY